MTRETPDDQRSASGQGTDNHVMCRMGRHRVDGLTRGDWIRRDAMPDSEDADDAAEAAEAKEDLKEEWDESQEGDDDTDAAVG